MRNKSRKRILHEQRVEIARLNRDVDDYRRALERSHWDYAPTQTICYVQIVRNDTGRDEREMLFAHAGGRIIRDIARKIISSNVMQITTDKMVDIDAEKVTFKLKFLVPEHTDISPTEAFKSLDRVEFRDPEILYGGPHRGGEMFARQMCRPYPEDGDVWLNPLRRADIDRIVIEEGYPLPEATKGGEG
jgi:hypothetical protein